MGRNGDAIDCRRVVDDDGADRALQTQGWWRLVGREGEATKRQEEKKKASLESSSLRELYERIGSVRQSHAPSESKRREDSEAETQSTMGMRQQAKILDDTF